MRASLNDRLTLSLTRCRFRPDPVFGDQEIDQCSSSILQMSLRAEQSMHPMPKTTHTLANMDGSRFLATAIVIPNPNMIDADASVAINVVSGKGVCFVWDQI
jgi:hypothetical protein